MQEFTSLNTGFNQTFKHGHMSIGLVVPIDNYASSAIPDMKNHMALVKLAEHLGFTAVWLRDVPFHVPDFGDVGQIFDPFVYLGYLAAQTSRIALGVSSIVLPLRHPAHVAKSAASIDQLSNGRLLLGVASGDRPQEYPVMNLDYQKRGEGFSDSVNYIRQMQKNWPQFKNQFGDLRGDVDMLPKATARDIPMLITGGSQQTRQWIAKHGDGWMIYPRQPAVQKQILMDWKEQLCRQEQNLKPVMQPLYFDMTPDSSTSPKPLHLGFSAGTDYLVEHLKTLEALGINHLALNLRFNKADIITTMHTLAEKVLPAFRANTEDKSQPRLKESA